MFIIIENRACGTFWVGGCNGIKNEDVGLSMKMSAMPGVYEASSGGLNRLEQSKGRPLPHVYATWWLHNLRIGK